MVTQTPIFGQHAFFKAKMVFFFKVFPTSEESHLKTFSGLFGELKTFLRQFGTTCSFDHFVTTRENHALHKYLWKIWP